MYLRSISYSLQTRPARGESFVVFSVFFCSLLESSLLTVSRFLISSQVCLVGEFKVTAGLIILLVLQQDSC